MLEFFSRPRFVGDMIQHRGKFSDAGNLRRRGPLGGPSRGKRGKLDMKFDHVAHSIFGRCFHSRALVEHDFGKALGLETLKRGANDGAADTMLFRQFNFAQRRAGAKPAQMDRHCEIVGQAAGLRSVTGQR